MTARETAEFLLQVARLLQTKGYEGQLNPAQWMALRYLARANRFSRTPSAFAEFQATTRGTASATIKSLELGQYLVRLPSGTDGRSISLHLTRKGKKVLARDPFEVLVRAVEILDAKTRAALHHALHRVLATVAASGTHQRFGICQDCVCLSDETTRVPTTMGHSARQCQFFGVPIQQEDINLLCVHFQPASERRDGRHQE